MSKQDVSFPWESESKRFENEDENVVVEDVDTDESEESRNENSSVFSEHVSLDSNFIRNRWDRFFKDKQHLKEANWLVKKQQK